MLSTAAATTALVGPGAKPTKSWWPIGCLPMRFPPALAAPPRTADVVVIGAGMTGCATAYWLKKLQRDGAKSCVVLDARGVAGGATGRNGGHLWANPESEFEREVTKDVLKFIEEEGVECDLTAAARRRSSASRGPPASNTTTAPTPTRRSRAATSGATNLRGTRRRARPTCAPRPLPARASFPKRRSSTRRR